MQGASTPLSIAPKKVESNLPSKFHKHVAREATLKKVIGPIFAAKQES